MQPAFRGVCAQFSSSPFNITCKWNLNAKFCYGHGSQILSSFNEKKPQTTEKKPQISTQPPHTLLYDSEIHTAHFSILHILQVTTNNLF